MSTGGLNGRAVDTLLRFLGGGSTENSTESTRSINRYNNDQFKAKAVFLEALQGKSILLDNVKSQVEAARYATRRKLLKSQRKALSHKKQKKLKSYESPLVHPGESTVVLLHEMWSEYMVTVVKSCKTSAQLQSRVYASELLGAHAVVMECSHRSLVGKHGIITNVSENCYYISGIGGSAGNRNSKVLGKRKNHSSNHVESSESKDSEAAKIEDCEKDIHGQAVVIRVIKAESVMAILLPEPSELDDRLSDSTRQSSGVCSAIKIGADGQSDFVPCTPLALQPIQKHRGQVCILHGSKYLRLPTSGGKT